MELDRTVLFGGLDRPRVLVMGLGESGLAIARWCALHGCALTLADSRETPSNLAAALAFANDPAAFVSTPADPFPAWVFGRDGDAEASTPGGRPGNEAVTLVAISPGLSPLDPAVAALLEAARRHDVPVWGELTFFDHALRALAQAGHPADVIAITGTNGKTTTTELTGRLVERAGRRVAVAGNISPSMLDRLADVLATASGEAAAVASTLPEVWVLELSSFQLDTAAGFAPRAAAVLNVTQDHLDWHGGMEAYTAAKFKIFGEQTVKIVGRGDPVCMAWFEEQAAAQGARAAAGTTGRTHRADSRPRAAVLPETGVVTFGTDAPQRAGDFGIVVEGGLEWLAQARDGRMDQEALPAAATVTGEPAPMPVTRRRTARNSDDEAVRLQPLMPSDALRIRGRHNAGNALAALALCRALGLPLAPLLHGLREYEGAPHRVSLLAVIDGVDFIDDSKATNVGATVAGIAGFDRPVVLIAGGDGKGQDFHPLFSVIDQGCKAVMLIGRDAPLIRAALDGTRVPLQDQPTLEQAVTAAAALAQAGDIVLLSPACASFDMFRNYRHRADVFRQCVEEVAAARGVML